MGLGSNKMVKALWNFFIMSLLWNISTERNSRVFEQEEMAVENIFEQAKFAASLWASTDEAFKNIPFQSF